MFRRGVVTALWGVWWEKWGLAWTRQIVDRPVVVRINTEVCSDLQGGLNDRMGREIRGMLEDGSARSEGVIAPRANRDEIIIGLHDVAIAGDHEQGVG